VDETGSSATLDTCAMAVAVLPFSSSVYGQSWSVVFGHDRGRDCESWQQRLSSMKPQAIKGQTVRMLRSAKASTDATADLIFKTLDARDWILVVSLRKDDGSLFRPALAYDVNAIR